MSKADDRLAPRTHLVATSLPNGPVNISLFGPAARPSRSYVFGTTGYKLRGSRIPDADAALLEDNMKSNGTLTLVQSIYDHVHLALWATLAAFVVFFLAFIAPRLPEAAARAEALRIQEIAEENEGYCAKLQMGLGTKMHDQCISDLQELRWKIQGRLADRIDF
jgi:hypothetical protein